MPPPRHLMLALLPVLGFAAPVAGQIETLAVELRGGVAAPGEGLGGGEHWAGDPKPGASFGIHFALTIRPRVAPYVGFSQHRAACPPEACAGGGNLVSTGWDVGLRVPLAPGRLLNPWLQAGLVSHRVEVPGGGGGLSRRATGFEAGVGVAVRLPGSMALAPALRWVHLDATFRDKGDLRLRPWVADLGLLVAF